VGRTEPREVDELAIGKGRLLRRLPISQWSLEASWELLSCSPLYFSKVCIIYFMVFII